MTSVGDPKSALDTPVLLVDLDIMEANIERIATLCRQHNVNWRPHIKGQKTIEIIRKELAAGAVGVTCAKLGEAEVVARAGIRNILIANQIVGAIKMRRLTALLQIAEPIVAVDSFAHLDALVEAARAAAKALHVVIEIDIGMKRAGLPPGNPVVAMAGQIDARPELRFRGVVGWESHAVTIADPAQKASVVAEAIGLLTQSAEACREAGYPVDIVSCGGTGTFPYCIEQSGVTEVQVGGGIFSDNHYRDNFHIDLPCALTVLATVTSRPNPTRIVLDSGKKSMSSDTSPPSPVNIFAMRQLRLSAEHATIELEEPSPEPKIGDRVEFIVGYSDTTVHLHDEIVGIRDGRVEAVWPVAMRGKSK